MKRTRRPNRAATYHFEPHASDDESGVDAESSDNQDEYVAAESDDAATLESDSHDGGETPDDDVEEGVSHSAGRARSGADRNEVTTFNAGKGSGPEQAKSTPEEFDAIATYPFEYRATRSYYGPLNRWDRLTGLIFAMYGPDRVHLDIISDLRVRWHCYPFLPARSTEETADGAVLRNPWLSAATVALHEERLRIVYACPRSSAHQQSRPMARGDFERVLPRGGDGLKAFLGPSPNQRQYDLSPGEVHRLDDLGRPVEDNRSPPAGFLIDIGGVPVSLDWAPRKGWVDQMLAIAVVPYEDQADDQTIRQPSNVPQYGHILLYRVAVGFEDGVAPHQGALSTALDRVVGFRWGRPKRLQWCPVPMDDTSSYGLLAVLCGDGVVRVVDVQRSDEKRPGESRGEHIDSPMFVVGAFPGESSLVATCFTWVDAGRLAVGHSDGSISTWSLWPTLLVQRLRLQTGYILDICSGYPSYPNMITFQPLSGHPKLVDLAEPSCEITVSRNAIVSFQPGLLRWSELMQGFVSCFHATHASNTSVGFMHVRHFARVRSVFAGRVANASLAIGVVHPYLLVGCVDGSLWAANSIRKVLNDKLERVFKIKLFEHEFRPVGNGNLSPEQPVRGAVRFLQGFSPEINDSIRSRNAPGREMEKEATRGKRSRQQKPAKAKARPKADGAVRGEEGESEQEAMDTDGDEDEEKQDWEPEKRVVHEAQTRVSAVAWNPNLEFGWWAAAGMGSGLVRIMELGMDHYEGPESEGGRGAGDELP